MRTSPRTPICLALLALLAIALGLPALPRATAAEPLTARWRFSGLAARDAATVAVDPTDGRTIYATAPFGDLYRSADGGGAWLPLYDFAYVDPPVFIIDPVNPRTLYASNVNRAYKSIDAGASWTALTISDVRAIAVDPRNNQIVYAAPWFEGLSVSTTGGAGWASPGKLYEVRDLAVAPDSGAVYATAADGPRNPDGRGGLYKSIDGGLSWTRVLTDSALNKVLIDPVSTSTIYLATEGAGVLKSLNGGQSWSSSNAGLAHRVVRALAISPTNSMVLYAGTWEGGVYKSSDGGASWSPFNEGLDNLYILSLAVDPSDARVLYAGTRGGGVFKFSGPPKPGPDQLYASVVDEAGEPVAGAWIFHNGQQLRDELGEPARTDGAGNLVLSGVSPGDTLVAALLQREQPTARSGHAGWAYRVLTTSMDIGSDGAVRGHSVTGAVGPQTLTLRAQNTLVLFNLVVAVEWNADLGDLGEISAGMAQASQMLFDMSDGQMAFGAVTIFDGVGTWGDADIQIAAANIVRPHAFVGGITASDKAHVVRLGRGWDGRSGAQGSWAAANGYRTIAHEFGHYGLYLRDEYFGYAPAQGGGYGAEVPATCTDAATRALAAPGAAASVMDDQYRTSELSARDVAGLWSTSCTRTAQWQLNGESAWETLARRYADASPTPRWRITTPAERGGTLEGPDGLPATLMALPVITLRDDEQPAGRRTLTVIADPGSAPVRGAIVALQKRDGRVLGQGLTDTTGTLVVYGAEPGDLLRVTSFDAGLHGKLTVGADERPVLRLTSVAGALAQQGGTNPHIVAVAQPADGGQVALLIALQGFGPEADPYVVVTAPGSTVGNTPLLSYSPLDGSYAASFAFAATERGAGQVRADRRVGGERPMLYATYRLQRVQNDRPEAVFSHDGHLSLQLPPGGLPGAESYLVIMPTGATPGEPPAGLAQVGEAYAITASGAVAALDHPAALTLSYDDALVSAAPQGLAIYRWDPPTTTWRPISGADDAERRAVSATVSALGTYALMAPAGPWTQPELRVWLPAVRR